jgi:hypothetical protein
MREKEKIEVTTSSVYRLDKYATFEPRVYEFEG